MLSYAHSLYDRLFSLSYDAQGRPINSRSDSLENSKALEKFLSSIEKRAFRRAQIATGGSDEAFDIVQEAMFTLVKKYANKKTEDWELLFHKILSSRIIDWHRRATLKKRFGFWSSKSGNNSSENDYEIDIEDPVNSNPESKAETDYSMNLLEQFLEELPMRQQQVFLLRAWEGLSEKETAQAMSCSTGAVKSHYSRARNFLKLKLEEHDK